MPKRITAKLISNKLVSSNIYELTFEPSEQLIFQEGQYVWIILESLKYPDTHGERRAFSISSASDQTQIQFLIRATQSGYSRTLLELKPGDFVKIYGPFGSFLKSGIESTSDLVFIAGGIAMAPFLSVIRSFVNKNVERNIYLINATKTAQELVYNNELKGIASKYKNFFFVSSYPRIDQSQINNLNVKFPFAKWYVTGSQGFVDSVWEFLKNLNIGRERVGFEEHYPLTEEFASLDKSDLDLNSMSFFKLAVDKAFLHFIITDINGHVLYANEAAQKLTGYSFQEMLGNTPRLWGGLMSPDFYEKLWLSKKYNQQAFSGKITNCRKNGEIYTAQATIAPIINSKGVTVGFIGTEEDITREEEVRLDQRRLASIVESSQDAILSKDLSGKILSWNSGASEMYGYLASEIIGENIQIIIPENLKGEEMEIIRKIENGEIIKSYDTQRVRKDGQILDVELSVSPIKDEKGRINSISVVARNITEQKKERENTIRMNRLMVGRELRMIELKNQIKKLTGE